MCLYIHNLLYASGDIVHLLKLTSYIQILLILFSGHSGFDVENWEQRANHEHRAQILEIVLMVLMQMNIKIG